VVVRHLRGKRFMPAKVFVDTNILVYAHDLDAGKKHLIAKNILAELWERREGALSTQVLHEFYVNATRKISKPLARQVARSVVHTYETWCVETIASDIATAFRIEDEARISYWDALICAAALKAGSERVLSEDLNSGQRIAGLYIENPFVT
jgi:predicted nucleic acid-binding protein